jgi:hypothetical protein
MGKMKINEGELITPAFNDVDEQVNAEAMAIWADFIKALSVIDKEFLSSENPKPEIAGALLQGMSDEAGRRLGSNDDEPDDAEVADGMDEPDLDTELPDEGGEEVAAEPEGDDFATEEGLEPDTAETIRFRQIAGIPHAKNYI